MVSDLQECNSVQRYNSLSTVNLESLSIDPDLAAACMYIVGRDGRDSLSSSSALVFMLPKKCFEGITSLTCFYISDHNGN